MKFLKANKCGPNDLYDGKPELFNLDQVLTIQPHGDGKTAKILMGAGLYWDIYVDSIELIECYNDLKEAITHG